MSKEDRELLLLDIYARLLYVVKGIITYDVSNTIFTVEGIDNNVLHLSYAEECYVEDFKPYLRPMSSMTEEEKKEYDKSYDIDLNECANSIKRKLETNDLDSSGTPMFNHIDWLNAHHFDYRRLIEKGLALKAPEGMYEF